MSSNARSVPDPPVTRIENPPNRALLQRPSRPGADRAAGRAPVAEATVHTAGCSVWAGSFRESTGARSPDDIQHHRRHQTRRPRHCQPPRSDLHASCPAFPCMPPPRRGRSGRPIPWPMLLHLTRRRFPPRPGPPMCHPRRSRRGAPPTICHHPGGVHLPLPGRRPNHQPQGWTTVCGRSTPWSPGDHTGPHAPPPVRSPTFAPGGQASPPAVPTDPLAHASPTAFVTWGRPGARSSCAVTGPVLALIATTGHV